MAGGFSGLPLLLCLRRRAAAASSFTVNFPPRTALFAGARASEKAMVSTENTIRGQKFTSARRDRRGGGDVEWRSNAEASRRL